MRDILLTPIQLKDVTTTGAGHYIIDLLAAVYGNKDLGNDIILPGAFTKSLRNKGNERPILWQHSMADVIGKGVFTDTTKGLMAKCYLPKDDDLVTKRVMPQIGVGSVKGASIGYETQEADFDDSIGGCRKLKTLDLFETSLVTIPMNPLAQIVSVTKAANNMGICEFKGMDKNLKNYIYELMEDLQENKTVSGKDYPFADDTVKWDASKAIERIKDYSGSKDKPSATYKNFFMWYDSDNADNFTAYKLPYVDIISGKPKIVPKAIYAIAGALSGARGGLDIPAGDKAKIKAKLNKFYEKMGKDSPFKDDGKCFIIADTIKYMSRKQIAGILDGDEDIELSKGAKDLILDGFRPVDKSVRSPGEIKSNVLNEFLTTVRLFNSQI